MALGARVNVSAMLTSAERRKLPASRETENLLNGGMLEGAALFDLRFNVVECTAWLLFDCKGALQIRGGNTAVVVLRAVRALEWHTPALGPRMWQRVEGWATNSISASERVLTLALEVGDVRASFSAAEFFIGDVPGGDEAPPDFEEASDEEMTTRLQNWNSEFESVSASFFDTV